MIDLMTQWSIRLSPMWHTEAMPRKQQAVPCGRPTASGGECGNTTTKRPPDCGQHDTAAHFLGLEADAFGRESPAERYAIFNDDGNLVAAYEDLDEAIDGVRVCLGAGSIVDTETQQEAWRSTAEDEVAFVPPIETGDAVYFNDGKVLRLGSGRR